MQAKDALETVGAGKVAVTARRTAVALIVGVALAAAIVLTWLEMGASPPRVAPAPTPSPNTTATPATAAPTTAPIVAATPAVVPDVAHGCASTGLAPFPWPKPPEPSTSATIPRRLIFADDGSERTLAAVAARLDAAIAGAGYLQPRYLAAGCDGFAVVLDLEHIEADGSRARGVAGFAPPSQDEPFSLASFVRRLFYAPPGHYRQIVIVVSDERMAAPAPAPDESQLRVIARDGVSALPRAFASRTFSSRHELVALIYEFEKDANDGDVRWIAPEGRLGATVHLKKSKLY